MVQNKILIFGSKAYHSVFITIILALCMAYLILSGFSKIPLGALMLVALFLYLKKVEDLFLFWLLTFSFFSIDRTAFLTVNTHPIITYDRVFLAILLFIFLKQITLKERSLVPINNIEIIFILLLFTITFSVATKTFNKLMGARVLTDQFLLPFLVYVLSKNLISDSKYFRKFVNILFVVAIYLSTMGIYEHFSIQDLFATEAGIADGAGWIRVNGPYEASTTFGACTAICFFIALYKYIISSKSRRFLNKLYIPVLGMITISMFFSLYRGIWLAWVLGLLTWFVIRGKGLIKLIFSIIALAIIIIPFVNKIRSSEFYDVRLANVETVQDRFEKYNYALSLFRESPIDGIGFRNHSQLARTTGQHNQIIAMLSETGIIGASSYIALILALLYYGVQSYKSSTDYYEKQFSIIYLSILVVYFVVGLGLNTGFDKGINFLFFSLAGCALNGSKKKYMIPPEIRTRT